MERLPCRFFVALLAVLGFWNPNTIKSFEITNYRRRIRHAEVSPCTTNCYRHNNIGRDRLTFRTKRPKSQLKITTANEDIEDDILSSKQCDDSESASCHSNSRRKALQSMVAASALCITSSPLAAFAGVAEMDSSTGQLYTPKSEMLSGGSDAARGIRTAGSRSRLKPGEALQSVYETRFIAYLSRFLLSADPSCRAWWLKQGLPESYNVFNVNRQFSSSAEKSLAENTFAEFAESVELGLADYFVGPYGSYASLSAMKAGLFAVQPAFSEKPESKTGKRILKSTIKDDRLLFGQNQLAPAATVKRAKQGILNLYSLLKTRYSDESSKRQLAILFSMISSPLLQPVDEIRGLLGEADNATVTEVKLVRPNMPSARDVESFRTSCRRGGGYSIDSFPEITIDQPPALGADYKPATAKPIMRPTSRLLRIRVVDPGEGYTTSPQVRLIQGSVQRACQTAAILDRQGRVESVILTDPGFGYGGRGERPPLFEVDAPKPTDKNKKTRRKAKVVADLEYEIIGVEIVDGGNGYVMSEAPKVSVSPPEEEPDWFVTVQENPELRMVPKMDTEFSVSAEVTEMRNAASEITRPTVDFLSEDPVVNEDLINQLKQDPLRILPASVRPKLITGGSTGRSLYTIPSLVNIPQSMVKLSPRYRAFDPIFGGIGSIPVQKGALELRAGEYARLALSGALCTVIVRTLLNPLELIKTKQQLQNDDELLDFAKKKIQANNNIMADSSNALPRHFKEEEQQLVENRPANQLQSPSLSEEKHLSDVLGDDGDIALQTLEGGRTKTNEEKPVETEFAIGTVDMIKSLVEFRGPFALFQSADITFLASLVFGSFGFGATELFRRFFTSVFYTGGEQGSELILLVAASIATVVTAAAASPFELLRVRSMGRVVPEKWTSVLQSTIGNGAEKDYSFLWVGFAPTLSRELPFAITKFLVFDVIAKFILAFLNGQAQEGAPPIQVGTGPTGLAVSAGAGALAGIAAAIVSHPADLILTYTTAASGSSQTEPSSSSTSEEDEESPDWRDVVRDLTSKEGGFANLFLGLPARATFFFLVIGLQFFLYDFVKTLLQVGSDDLNLVLDVFYAIRAGL